MLATRISFVLLLLSSAALGKRTNTGRRTSDVDLCFKGCEFTLFSIVFNDTDQAAPKAARPCSGLKLSSILLCAHQYCAIETHKNVESLNSFNETCEAFIDRSLPPISDILGRYSDEEIKKLRRFEQRQIFGEPVQELLLPTDAFWSLAYGTLV